MRRGDTFHLLIEHLDLGANIEVAKGELELNKVIKSIGKTLMEWGNHKTNNKNSKQ